MAAITAVVAHSGPGTGHAGEIALTAIAISAMVIPLVVLGFIGRAFWRASKRDEPPAPSGQV